MKLFYVFLAAVAATETTVSSVETTAVATTEAVAESTVADVVATTEAVAESTVADVVETTASDDEETNDEFDCDEGKAFIIRAKQGLEEKELDELSQEIGAENGADVWKFLKNNCIEVCGAEGKNCDGIEFAYDNDFVCKGAKSALEAASNETEKTAMKTACDLACADVEGETCGFLVNGLSFVLFAILAIFKY